MPDQRTNSLAQLGKVNRRPGWWYLTVVLVMLLSLAAVSACADETDDGGSDDADTTEESAATDDADDTADDDVVDDTGEPLNVVVTMPFIPSMVDAVGGDHVEVESVVPQGVDAHTYQPSPGDAQMIADADVIFVNGFGLEEFLDELIESGGGVDAPIHELADGLQDDGIESDGHDHDDVDHADDDNDHLDDHDHDDDNDDDHDDDHHSDDATDSGSINPHFWLSPVNGVHYVENIYEGLADIDPDNEVDYRSNADEYIAEINEFDDRAQEEMAGIPDENRFVVTFHDAFPYFADHFGLEVVGVVITSPGREPGAQEMARLADQIQDVGVPAVFIEPQFDSSLADAIADEAGVQTQVLYSDTPPEGVGYLELMELNVESVVEGLS